MGLSQKGSSHLGVRVSGQTDGDRQTWKAMRMVEKEAGHSG